MLEYEQRWVNAAARAAAHTAAHAAADAAAEPEITPLLASEPEPEITDSWGQAVVQFHQIPRTSNDPSEPPSWCPPYPRGERPTSTSDNRTESTWTPSRQREPEEQKEQEEVIVVPDDEPQQDQDEHQEGQEEQQEQEDQQEQQDEEQETKKEEEQEDQEATGDPSTSTSTSGSSQLVDRSWQLQTASAAWLSRVLDDELSLS